ncbi:hypothetical protein [Pseudomonas syringae]|uniref:hypothetical protein n=1 Tax=Pseudomonas syringae TaxID=317 RepID=UPI001F1DE35B|nr:hypothetical protein [Pseudomonas syringae]MCF9005324.1 hypothetical protein [Pseudomonas syringae]
MLSYLGVTVSAIELILKTVTGISIKKAAPEEFNHAKLQAETMASIVLAQARTQQEQAIAPRVACAKEVQVEEYYDFTGKGQLGVTAME